MRGAIIAAVLLTATFAWSGTAKFEWDPITLDCDGDPIEDLAGYVGQWNATGPTAPDEAWTEVNVGLVTEYEFVGLPDCGPVWFRFAGYDEEGNRSRATDPDTGLCTDEPGWSPVVDGWPRPEVHDVVPSGLIRGLPYTLSVQGNNYAETPRVRTSNTGIAVQSVTWAGCGDLTVEVVVSQGADLGSFDLTVINPESAGEVFGVGQGILTVAADTVGPGEIPAVRRSFRWVEPGP